MTLVMADGCFDPLHSGHIEYLERAATFGTRLIVRVAPDADIWAKGRAPLLPHAERFATVASLKMVDIVCGLASLADAVRMYKPRTLVKGMDWCDRLPANVRGACLDAGTNIHYVDTAHTSSSALLRTWRQQTDSTALHAFEERAFTVKQQPYHFNGYTIEERRAAEGEHPRIVADVFGRDSTYLDYGCGPGHLITLLREQGISNVWGYEPPGKVQSGYDVVICREVLEHVAIKDIGALVADLVRCTTGYVYLTTRFHPEPMSAFDVIDEFSVDPTHITCLDQNLLRALFVTFGMRRRADLEERLDWKKKGRVLVYQKV